MIQAFALPYPWAFFDTEGGREMARQPLGNVPVRMVAGGAVYLAVQEGTKLKASGKKRSLAQEGPPFTVWGGACELLTMSVGTRPEEALIELSAAQTVIGSICLDGHLPRPGWTAGKDGGAPPDKRAEALDRFIMGTIARIRSVEDPAFASRPTHWERLAAAWGRDDAEAAEPPREAIVEHAEILRGLVKEIVDRKRRVLRRTREQMSLGRVQQVDTTCIRWLSRQPGDDVYERAGPRQRIMAIARREDVDTLENRVLRAYVDLAKDVSREYCAIYKKFSSSARWQLVDRYGAECKRQGRSLEEEGIGRPEPPVVPNFVLLHDIRYRRIWTAWQELRRRLDEEDEAWRWQHRLWTDFCRLAVHVSLRTMPHVVTMGESPLRMSHSQMRGRWSLVDGQTGVFLAEFNNRKFVLSVIGDLTAKHAKVGTWASAIGASCAVHAQALDTGKEAVMAVWPVHCTGRSRSSLESLVMSAGRSLKKCLDMFELTEPRPLAGGVVLLSEVEDGEHQPPARNDANFVFGLNFGPGSWPLADPLSKIALGILKRVDRLTA